MVVVIHFEGSEHLRILIDVDFYTGDVVEVETAVDTESAATFLSTVKTYAPDMLDQLYPCLLECQVMNSGQMAYYP